MKTKITNYSLSDIKYGNHHDINGQSYLIQITDPAVEPPIPKNSFNGIFHFEFLDADETDLIRNPSFEEFLITDEQAKSIVDILNHALKNNIEVIVHCHAGICRSGAVVEFAEMLGFEKCDKFRAPNVLVKHKLMNVMGWNYTNEEVKLKV